MQRRKASLFVGLSLALWLLIPGEGLAVTIYDNFGPGDTYNTLGGWTLSGSGTGLPWAPYESAMPFTPSGPAYYYLDEIELAVGLLDGTNQLDVWLMTDVGGLPGAIIESWQFNGAMGPFGSNNPPLNANSLLHPALIPGTQYWLAASAPASDTWAAWNLSNTGDIGGFASRSTGSWFAEGSHDERGAYRISGRPIPEPATLVLLGTGALGLIGCRRRRRK